jgi:aryl-alcohol dehydrogenase-like predicted oxidoreductase
MKIRTLGQHGMHVSRWGLGCTGMSGFYAGRDEVELVATIDLGLDRGVSGTRYPAATMASVKR